MNVLSVQNGKRKLVRKIRYFEKSGVSKNNPVRMRRGKRLLFVSSYREVRKIGVREIGIQF